MLPRKFLIIWALRNAISCILSHFQATFIVFSKKKKIKDRCPIYFRDSTRQFLILLSKICIVKILNDFRETGMILITTAAKQKIIATNGPALQ